MRTLVITGGTDGIGRHLADHYLARGDRVVVIGRDPAKGAAFRAAAGARGTFLRADLDSIARNRAVLTELQDSHPRIDALVLCARFYRSHRTLTTDGFEATFAHLSRSTAPISTPPRPGCWRRGRGLCWPGGDRRPAPLTHHRWGPTTIGSADLGTALSPPRKDPVVTRVQGRHTGGLLYGAG